MASAAAASRKGHLEAGKRKLEEFRRKKAAEKAKKATSTAQVHAADGVLFVRQPSEPENVPQTDFNDVIAEGHVGVRDIPKIASKESNVSPESDFCSTDLNAKLSHFASIHDSKSFAQAHSDLDNKEIKEGAAPVGSGIFGSAGDKLCNGKGDIGLSAQVPPWVVSNHTLDNDVSSIDKNCPSNHSDYYGSNNYLLNVINDADKYISRGDSGRAAVITQDSLPQNSAQIPLPDQLSNGSLGNNRLSSSTYPESRHSTSSITESAFGYRPNFSTFSDFGDQKVSDSANHGGSMNRSSPWTYESRYADYDSDARSSSHPAPPSPPEVGRRSRPSFLDDIPIPKGPSPFLSTLGTVKSDEPSSTVFPVDGLGSTVSQRSANSSVASGDGFGLFNNVKESKHDFFPPKQNEDFAALEQHIEDLTQEKFSLQRALEASRALAESLASENSALTESFNQQGGVVNQLKFDLDRLQEEIKAHLAELETVKIEYANAQMECNAADERAKLLATEVIGLEEKALRLRSNELKLERRLENTQGELSSYSKKLSSLEKDRQDLRSTINALQEEKKLLESKLRKASGKSLDLNNSNQKNDVSTSTEDLDFNTTREPAKSESDGNVLLEDDASTSRLPHEDINPSLEGLSMVLPSDQIRIIQNINTLIAELAMEKDQLMKALSEESSQNSKLLELNKELTLKLEAQTQRLELLMSQSMANDNIHQRQPDSHIMLENETYADEGDEVVERVLGWIMKLFPGGPPRRRPSRHL